MLRRVFIIFAVVWSLHWESLLAQEWPDELPPEIVGQHFTRIVTAVRAGHLIDPDNGVGRKNSIGVAKQALGTHDAIRPRLVLR